MPAPFDPPDNASKLELERERMERNIAALLDRGGSATPGGVSHASRDGETMPTPIAAEKRPMRPNPVPVTVATEKSSPLRRLELGSPVADETASLRTQVVELHGALAETQGWPYDEWEMRPTCQSWRTMRPPSRWTAAVTS